MIAGPLIAALITGEMPEKERQARLAPLFSPRPGHEITLTGVELRDHRRRLAPTDLRGTITVSPPRGVCLTIERREDEPDDTVCKKTTLAFALADLDRSGRLTWQVKTGEGDFGSRLTWPSPYRVGILYPFDAKPEAPPTYAFIAACRADRATALGRRLTIELMSGTAWIVTLPEVDTLEPQPPAVPNLYIHSATGKVSLKEAGAKNDAAKAAKEAGEGGGHGEAPAKNEEHGEAPPPPSKPEAPKGPADDDREIWAIPARGSYTMSASHFMPGGPVTPGQQGRCRYIYSGPPEDPETGRLECHDVDGYHSVFLPLTCLAQLKP